MNYQANLSTFDHRSQSRLGTAEDERNQFLHRLYVALPIVIKHLSNCSNDRDSPQSNGLPLFGVGFEVGESLLGRQP